MGPHPARGSGLAGAAIALHRHHLQGVVIAPLIDETYLVSGLGPV
jgi:hypothetical protein